MNKFSSLSLGLVLSIFSGACGTAINQPALSASNDHDGIVTGTTETIHSTVEPAKLELIACDIVGNENSLWSIPASSEENLTREAAVAKLNQLYGNAPRLAVQDCKADPNEPASGDPRHLASK